MKPDLLLLAQVGLSLLTIIYFGLLVRELKAGIDATDWEAQRKKKVGTAILSCLATWIVFLAGWSGSGMMADFSRFPFNFLPVLAIPLITIIVLTFSDTFTEILQRIPVSHLIRLQSFRFFVELLLWALFAASILPVQMTFEGRNFDILAGITAPLIAWLATRGRLSKTTLVIWNILCLGLLINIVTIAILSTPSPIRVFMNEPANTIVTRFPVSLLPGLLVPLAYTLHFFSLRQLFSRSIINAETANAKATV